MFGIKRTVIPIQHHVIRPGYCLSNTESWELIKTVTREEIKVALFDIEDDKTFDPDGYTSTFFKSMWDDVGGNIIEAVEEFFARGRILKSLNLTIVNLISKKSFNQTIADFRPIACCNVIYKVITKIISNILAQMLSKIVNEAQSAFITERNIVDNIHLAHELMRGYEIARSSRRSMTQLTGTFRSPFLSALNFHPIFMGWIMKCVSTPSFTIAVNGYPHDHFKGERVLRQGDSMSPSLFILCMEYLSRLIAVQTTENFNFHARYQWSNITHFAFVNDLMLFCRADPMSLQILEDDA